MAKKICVFGDSIAHGAFDFDNGGWVNQLKKYFETNNDFDVSVSNYSVVGDDTERLLKRFKEECSVENPQIIIFALGANDSCYTIDENNSTVPLNNFQNNLESLIFQAKNFSNEIIFIGITKVDESRVMPAPWTKEKFFSNKNIKQYNLVIGNISKKHDLLFLDLSDCLEESELDDGLHPGSSGHNKIFLEVKNFLLSKKDMYSNF